MIQIKDCVDLQIKHPAGPVSGSYPDGHLNRAYFSQKVQNYDGDKKDWTY